MEPSDMDLVERARDGSLDAFEALVRRYETRLLRFLTVRCGDRADAEDALQEAFASAWKYLATYRRKAAFSTWLYRIALRCAARAARRPPPTEAAWTDADPTMGDAVDEQRRSEIWAQAKACLSREQLSAVWLYYGEDRSVAEIGTILGRPGPWIKVNLHRARKRLARVLDRESLEGADKLSVPRPIGDWE